MMLTQLRLLILEDEDVRGIYKRLPEDELQALYDLHGKKEGAVEAFLALDDDEKEKTGLLYKQSKRPAARRHKGRFIVLEGLDGAGKTTHIDLLRKNLTACGSTVYSTAEPTASATGGLIRDALAGLHQRTAAELAALFLADRVQHNVNPKNGIRGFLDSGVDVICDRYYYSSLAYQGIDSDIGWVARMNLDCPDIVTPDACIFLDLSVEKCIERMAKDRVTAEIFETEEMIRRVKRRFADTFRMLNDRENIYIVNADRPRESVAAEIFDIVKGIK